MKLIKQPGATDVTDKNAPADNLSQLSREAEQLENATDLDTDEAVNGPAPPPPPDNAQLIAGAIALGRGVFTKVTRLQSVNTTLNDEVAANLGAVWGPVLQKHGIDLNVYLGDYALEIAAAVVTFEVMRTVREAHQAEVAAIKARKANAEKPAAEAAA